MLKTLHDELDRAVLDAYGWGDLAPLMEAVNGNAPRGGDLPATREECRAALDEALLGRLVALNAERAAEEARGLVRWLRPEFQTAGRGTQTALPEEEEKEAAAAPAAARIEKRPWPAELPAQVAAVAQVLQEARAPLAEADIAERFTGRGPWKKRLPQLLATLEALGRARTANGRYVAVS